jgi:osmoprotectant transport system permease protein
MERRRRIMMDFLNFLENNSAMVLTALRQHILISLTALGMGFAVAFPVGIFLSNHKKAAQFVLGFFGVVNTIPSIVLLGFAMVFLGIGFAPAVAVLFVYSLLPIMRNTYTGITGVPPKFIKAATGVGMSRMQTLTKVEIPLALPAIITGVRLSMVYIISWATLSTFIGAGGLGDIIWSGIQTFNHNALLAGAVPTTLLALGSSFLMSVAERASVRHAQGAIGGKA